MTADYPWDGSGGVAAEAFRRAMGQTDVLSYMRYVWPYNYPLLVGEHTRAITEALDRAVERYERGESSYLVVSVPFRHGKSDIISRHFPPYMLGRFRDAEVILATYNDDLSHAMSRDARSIFTGDEHRTLFPGSLLGDSKSIKVWSVAGRRGKLQSVGMGAGATGKGADVLLIDDYFKDREEAESETIRQKRWEAFTNNLMSRLAPVHIVVILATRWHVDDIIGRIQAAMTPGHRDHNPDFPPFEFITFPAFDEARYPSGVLFPERFDRSWYDMQRAQLGPYAFAALMQGSPTIRGGAMLAVDRVQRVRDLPDNLHWVRAWDLASTEKERAKDDPDYTVGAKVAVDVRPDGLEVIYVGDVRWCQAEAPARDRLIRMTAEADGPTVPVGTESVAGYKDTYTNLKAVLGRTVPLHKLTVTRDKVIRVSYIEPHFADGRVVMADATWTDDVLADLAAFPGGTHDDITDAIALAYHLAVKTNEQRRRFGTTLGRNAA